MELFGVCIHQLVQKRSHQFTKVPLSEKLAQRSVQSAVFASCSTTTMHLNNNNAIEVLSRSTTENCRAGSRHIIANCRIIAAVLHCGRHIIAHR